MSSKTSIDMAPIANFVCSTTDAGEQVYVTGESQEGALSEPVWGKEGWYDILIREILGPARA